MKAAYSIPANIENIASTPSFQLLVGVQGRKSYQIFIRIRARKGYAAGPGCSSSNPAFQTIYPSRSYGDRGFSDEKRCHVQFMASTNRRIITRIHRVLGHDTCNGELHTFWEMVPGTFLSPGRKGV